jgi:alkylhydroperoxidase/carboxymuconolactone decarboxylase family protein YurZ
MVLTEPLRDRKGIPHVGGNRSHLQSPGRGDAASIAVVHHQIWRMTLKSEQRRLLRRLTLNDEPALADVMAGRVPGESGLIDDKTRSLVRIAGLVALDANTPSLQAAVDNAFAAGAEDEEILEVILAVAPIVGSSRISSMLPRVHRTLERD